MRSLFSLAVIFAVIIHVSASVTLRPESNPVAVDENGTPVVLDDLSWFIRAVENADDLTVLEGLPHPFDEPDSYIRESTGKPIEERHNEAFYQQPLPIDNELTTKLTNAFLTERLYKARARGHRHWSSLCCIFHADYGLVWQRDGTEVAEALVCFGCDEIKMKAGQRSYYTALTPEGSRILRDLLLNLRANRPPYDRTRTDSRAELAKPSPVPSTAVELPNDVAEKAVKESAREPLADQTTEFWWLEDLLPPRKTKSGRRK